MFEEITKGIGMFILISVMGYTIAQYAKQSTVNLVNDIKVQKKIKENFDSNAKEIIALKAEVGVLKKSLSTTSIPQKRFQIQLQVDEVEQNLDVVSQRLKSIEGLIIEDPQKAYGLVALQKNMELFKFQAEKDIKDVGEKYQKQSDRIDTLFNILLSGLVGVVLVMLPSFIKNFRKPMRE